MERHATLATVRDFMRTDVFSLRPGMQMKQALEALQRRGRRAAPVVDTLGRPVGMFSESDCLRVLASVTSHEDPLGTVADHMTAPVKTLSPDLDVYRAAERFSASKLRVLPVVEGGKVVGVVTPGDLARALWQIQQQRESDPGGRKPEGAAWDPEQSANRDRRTTRSS